MSYETWDHTTLCCCAGVACADPSKLPPAGRIQVALFDKTGTLTADGLRARGLVTPGTTTTAVGANGSAGRSSPLVTRLPLTNTATTVTSATAITGTIGAASTASKAASASKVTTEFSGKRSSSSSSSSDSSVLPAAVVLAGCHSLMGVNGSLLGDPLEVSALAGVGWSYNTSSCTATEQQQGNSNTTSSSSSQSVHIWHRYAFNSDLQR
jgi:manganese-transporting P-type ATPase